MLKHLMNSGSLLSYVLRDRDSDGAEPTEIEKRRAEIAGNTIVADPPIAKVEGEDDENNEEETEDEKEEEAENEDEPELDADGNPIVKEAEETAEEKVAREKQEKIEAKAKRKDERIQKRIDTEVAARKTLETENARLKAQLEADPDKKLTPEQIESRANEIAATRLAERNAKELQDAFDNSCEKLAKDATKIDKEFNTKVHEMAEMFGPIPSFAIGILDDLENGGEVLAFLANDEDEAELMYELKDKPAKLAKVLVKLSDKLLEEKKPKVKSLSRVPNPIKPVNGTRIQNNTITGKESTDEYVRKRIAQKVEQRKQRGY